MSAIMSTVLTLGAVLHPALKDEAGCPPHNYRRSRAHSCANTEVSKIFVIHCASHVGGARIAVPILLAQDKGNQRIGEAWIPICSASPIVIEIVYLFW